MSSSLFVRFRKTRLTLARRIPTLEQAEARLEKLRANRLHDQDAVFVVEDVVSKPRDGKVAS